MDSKFRSSFIPKSSMDEGGDDGQKFGLLSGLAVVLFVASMLASGGFFAYKMMLQGDIDNLKAQLASAEAQVDAKAVNDIIVFDKRIESIREVLKNHILISYYFDMLEKNTVSQVQFNDLKYFAGKGENIAVEMNGTAKSYSAIALQEDTFLKNPFVISANFSSMKVAGKDGSVEFNFKGEFKKDLVQFQIPITNTQPTTQTSTTTSVSNDSTDLSGLDSLPDVNDI